MQIIKKHSTKFKLSPLIILLVLTFAICLSVSIVFIYSPSPAYSPSNKTTGHIKSFNVDTPPKAIKPEFNKSLYSNIDPSSIWLVVNKQHPLSTLDYIPSDLVVTNGATISGKAKLDFEAMISSAANQGINLIIGSSYRSYGTQSSLYNNYVASSGQAAADTFSAKAGYSEHQTGLAIDFTGQSNPNCNYDDCYETTVEGAWLNAHAYEYGFLLRYTTDKQPITGYKNEPWHYRYIGKDLALEMKNKNITTLEEFFSITGGISY